MWVIIILVVVFYFYASHKYYQANKPENIIDKNELLGYENKNKLDDYIEKELKMREEQFAEAEKKKDKESMKKLENLLTEIYCIKDTIIPEFERNYIVLQTRYKSSADKLIEISHDYQDWYYQLSKIFDPVNYELWNDNSWENQDEARIIINELNRKLSFQKHWKKLNKFNDE